jgi:hypothetical protein
MPSASCSTFSFSCYIFAQPSACPIKTKLSKCTMIVSHTCLTDIFSLILSDRADAVANHHSTSGAPRWDNTLAADAQQWAQYTADTNNMVHSGVVGQGENIYASSRSSNLANAAKAWCSEEKNYNGQILPGGDFESYGHYTQVVWPSTTAVGMGSAKSASGSLYVCGRYTPAGNYDGQSAWRPGGTAKERRRGRHH